PQDLKFKDGTPSGVRIGAETEIREYVTVHRSTRAGEFTEIGAGCLIMAMSHVAHDCRLGDGVIVINYAGITGHCEIGDRATIGGYVGLVPFTRVGSYAYIGGCSKVTADVPPYVLVDGNPAGAHAINVVGLRRGGVKPADRRLLPYAELWDIDLVGLVDIDRDRAKQVAAYYDTQVLSDHRELIGKVDLASVAVPTEQHFQVAADLLEAGVGVLVEKPITPTLEEA